MEMPVPTICTRIAQSHHTSGAWFLDIDVVTFVEIAVRAGKDC